jgi:hypothetical protein
MRTLLALTLLSTAACASSAPGEGGADYDSVRDRMTDGSTRLYVGAEGSSGMITARRYTSAGWVSGDTAVTIQNGEIAAKVDARGTLTVEHLEVALAPIEIPEDVFKKPAQLDDVRLTLRKPASAPTVWTTADDAHATLTLELDFDWSIFINGGKTPLGTQHLPPVTIDVAITGAGDHVDASVALAASGELWNWAGLIEMTKLELSLSAATAD